MGILWISSCASGILKINIRKKGTFIQIKLLTISFQMSVQIAVTPRFPIVS